MKLTKFTGAQIKRTAQNCYSITKRMEKINETINQLQEEYNELTTQYEEYNAPIKRLTGGYTSNELVDRVVTNTGKMDKNGNEIKTVQWVLKYPETIVPEKKEETTVDSSTEAFLESVKEQVVLEEPTDEFQYAQINY